MFFFLSATQAIELREIWCEPQIFFMEITWMIVRWYLAFAVQTSWPTSSSRFLPLLSTYHR